MSPTATKPASKKGDPMARLVELESAVEAANEEAKQRGADYADTLKAFTALTDKRRQLIHRDRSLVDHLHNASAPDNEVAEIDKKLEALGDLDDLRLKMEHARDLAGQAKDRVSLHINENLDAILSALQPEAEAMTGRLEAWAHEGLKIAEGYLGLAQRVEGYLHADPTRSGIRSLALDEAGQLRRELQGRVDAGFTSVTELNR